jgi:hypothetical protein
MRYDNHKKEDFPEKGCDLTQTQCLPAPCPDYVKGRTQPVGYYQHNIFMAFLARADPESFSLSSESPVNS